MSENDDFEWMNFIFSSSDNDFVVILELPEGEHEYKFQIDGRWEYDLNEVDCIIFFWTRRSSTIFSSCI